MLSAILSRSGALTIRGLVLAMCTLMSAVSVPAMAQSHSTTMSVSAIIENNCAVAASPMSFTAGNVTTASSVDGTARISVNCTSSTAFTVEMDRGLNASGKQRRMVSENGDHLDYEIFSDASRTIEWGGAIQSVSDEIRGANRKEIIAYGRINAVAKDTRSGVYHDTVTVSVNF